MDKKAYIFVSPRSDPGIGVRLDDPIFGRITTMGQCRPDLRRLIKPGDHIFVISGTNKGVSQYVIGGFEVDEKLDALLAHKRFPDLRLKIENGEKVGNIIVDGQGKHHPLDHHPEHNFKRRIQNYLVGRNHIQLNTDSEIRLGRENSLEILKEIFNTPRARKIREIIGRSARMDEAQVDKLLEALKELKTEAKSVQSR